MRTFYWRRFLIYTAVFFLALIIQFSWMKFLAPAGIAPNLVLVLVIVIGIMRGSFAGEMMGFFLGLAWDTVSVDLFGSHAFMLTLIGYLSGLLSRKWDERKIVSQMILTGGASLIFAGGIFTLYQVFSPSQYEFRVNYLVIFQPVCNMLIAPVIFKAGELLAIRYVRDTEEF